MPQTMPQTPVITVSKSKLSGSIRIPASKSHTIRAVAIAGMAQGTSRIKKPLESADTLSSIQAIRALGAKAEINHAKNEWVIQGSQGKIQPIQSLIDVGNSGTTLRIMTALAALGKEKISFDGDASIRQRLMEPLLSSLNSLGVQTESQQGKCPLSVQGPIQGGLTKVKGISSQFVTALLLACPLAQTDSEIHVEELNEQPYVEMTLGWLQEQSIQFVQRGLNWFKIFGRQFYHGFDKEIPADFSSATFPLCAAAITQSPIVIQGLDFSDSQGDKQVIDYLKKMGIQFEQTADGLAVLPHPLRGVELDLNATPDALPAMAVVACFAQGKTILKNVPQARLKECDRIQAMTAELTKMGARIIETPDGMIIENSPLKPVSVHGHFDHRIVMALSIAGMAISGKTMIDTADSIQITFPTFITDMKKIGAQIEIQQ